MSLTGHLTVHSVSLSSVVLFLPFSPRTPPSVRSYTGGLYAALSFAAMWLVVSDAWLPAAMMMALAGASRSNGVLHAGFFLFAAAHRILQAWERASTVKVGHC